jgi:peroxiredoxin
MKQNSCLLFLSLLLLSACSKSNEYNLTGSFDDNALNGHKVVLYGISQSTGLSGVDSTFVENNTFKLKGKVDSVGWYVLMIQKEATEPIYKDFYLNESSQFTFRDGRLKVSGSEINDKYQAFEDRYLEMSKEIMLLNRQLQTDAENEALKSNFNKAYQAFLKSFGVLSRNAVLENMDNPLGLHLFEAALPSLPDEEVAMILSKASPEFLANPTIKMVSEQLAMSSKVKVGNKCPDLIMKGVDGQNVSLSQFMGKGSYVLIDFWASWCGPCIKEMPALISLYNKYKSKGFQIVGVSLDDDEAAWKAEIKKQKMTWPQISDLSAWRSEAVSVFSFSSIPYTVLVDPNGLILANGLRGEALSEKLKDIFK